MTSLPDSILEAANRLADNLAFVVNHASLPDQWHEKLVRELEEDRAKIASYEAALAKLDAMQDPDAAEYGNYT